MSARRRAHVSCPRGCSRGAVQLVPRWPHSADSKVCLSCRTSSAFPLLRPHHQLCGPWRHPQTCCAVLPPCQWLAQTCCRDSVSASQVTYE